MTFLPSQPDDTTLLDVFHAFPEAARPLLQLHEVVLRGPSPLTVAERELIAAYVSGLNACTYCFGVHSVTAATFGVAEDTLVALLSDPESAPVDERMRPLLRYVAKLTMTPARVTAADAEAVLAAGWQERALHDAVSVCALFSFMNRYVDGLGVRAEQAYFQVSGERLARMGYDGLRELI